MRLAETFWPPSTEIVEIIEIVEAIKYYVVCVDEPAAAGARRTPWQAQGRGCRWLRSPCDALPPAAA